MIFLKPLLDYNEASLNKVWVYEQANPLPSSAKACEATLLFHTTIAKNEEVIIRDSQSRKVIAAVYRNRIGPEALEIICSTIVEIMQKRWQIAKSSEIKSYNQGSMTAAG